MKQIIWKNFFTLRENLLQFYFARAKLLQQFNKQAFPLLFFSRIMFISFFIIYLI